MSEPLQVALQDEIAAELAVDLARRTGRPLRFQEDAQERDLQIAERDRELLQVGRDACNGDRREVGGGEVGAVVLARVDPADEDGEANDKYWYLIGKEIDLDEMTTLTLGTDGTLTVQLADDKTTLVFLRQ